MVFNHSAVVSRPCQMVPLLSFYKPGWLVFILFHVREGNEKVHHHTIKLALEGKIGSDGVANGTFQQSRDSPSPGFKIGTVAQCTVFQNGMAPVCFRGGDSGSTVEYVHISLLRPFAEATADFCGFSNQQIPTLETTLVRDPA